MGECKKNMEVKENTKASIFGSLVSGRRRERKESKEDKAVTFAEMITNAETKLNDLIIIKNSELTSEKGREEYNRRSLAILSTIQYHLDEIIEQMALYEDN